MLGGALPLDGAARELVRAGPFDLTMQHPNPRQTWVHSCCSVEKHKRALADPNVTAIEADIVMSSGVGGKHAAGVPVMAHPPRKSSDLVFSQFMDLVVADGSRHIKLDFKESAAVEPCLALLAARAPELLENGQVKAPLRLAALTPLCTHRAFRPRLALSFVRHAQAVWLNADVLPGPNARHSAVPVPASTFLPLCRRICPFALLSLGWRLSPIGPEESYTERDAALMERLCLDHAVSGDRVVFAAAVRFAEQAPRSRRDTAEICEGMLVLSSIRRHCLAVAPAVDVSSVSAVAPPSPICDRQSVGQSVLHNPYHGAWAH